MFENTVHANKNSHPGFMRSDQGRLGADAVIVGNGSQTVKRQTELLVQPGKFTEFPAGSPGLEPREECGLSKFFNLGPNPAKPCT